MEIAFYLFKYELKQAMRQKMDYLHPVVFFILIVSLFPLAIIPDNQLLKEMAPGIIWIGALLSNVLALQPMFRQDADSGFLDKLLLSTDSLLASVVAKIAAHWIMTGLPLVLLAPLLGIMLDLSWHSIGILVLSLLLGTPILSFIGAIGVSLTLSVKQNGLLLPFLVLPLFIPVLIFGSSAVIAAGKHLPSTGQLQILGAFLLIALLFAPFAVIGALRIGEFQ